MSSSHFPLQSSVQLLPRSNLRALNTSGRSVLGLFLARENGCACKRHIGCYHALDHHNPGFELYKTPSPFQTTSLNAAGRFLRQDTFCHVRCLIRFAGRGCFKPGDQ